MIEKLYYGFKIGDALVSLMLASKVFIGFANRTLSINHPVSLTIKTQRIITLNLKSAEYLADHLTDVKIQHRSVKETKMLV